LKKFIFIILVVFFGINSAKCVEINTEISDYYKVRYDKYGNIEHKKIAFFNFEEQPAFCIEPFETTKTGIDYEIKESIEVFNDDILRQMSLIAYYGYNYPNHQTMNYRLATQILIWQKAGSETFNVYYLDVANELNLNNEINEIIKLMNKHEVLPSFINQNINISYNEELVLKDEFDVLNNYNITCQNANCKVIDNNLIIKSLNKESVKINFERKKVYFQNRYFYEVKNYQSLISAGEFDYFSYDWKIPMKLGSVSLKKIDLDNNQLNGYASLKGAEYGIYQNNGNYITSIITDEMGCAKTEEILVIGDYYVQEIKPSKGYLLDETKYYFSILKNELEKEIIVYEDIIKRDFEIIKVFASDKTEVLKPEKNVQFAIYDTNDRLLFNLFTNDDGKILFTLPFGKYVLKQITTSLGYEKMADFHFEVLESGPVVVKYFANAGVKAKLKVNKVEEITQNLIKKSGVKFKIFNLDKQEYVSQVITYPNVLTITEFITNEDGYFITPFPLEPGNYQLEEIDQYLNGFLWNKVPYKFTIDENNLHYNPDLGLIKEITFTNKLVETKLEILKLGQKVNYENNSFFYEDIPLENVKIGLYANENIIDYNLNILYQKDELIDIYETNELGLIIINDLYFGKYYLKEIKSLNNYILDKEKYEIEIKYKDQYTKNITERITLKNYFEKGTINFLKTDSLTDQVLANTLIEIYTLNDQLVYSGYTDIFGQINIELPKNEYYLIEKEALNGYLLNNEKIFFKINENNEIIKIKMQNELAVTNIPNTNKDTLIIKIFLLTVLLILFKLSSLKVKVVFCLILAIYIGFIFIEKNFEERKIDLFMQNQIVESIPKNKIDYLLVLEIPKINLQKGIYKLENKNNNVNKNVMLLKESSMPDVMGSSIILAAHSGNDKVAYFNDLDLLEVDDEIIIYYDQFKYIYQVKEIFNDDKDGNLLIEKNNFENMIILITCQKNSDDLNLIVKGILNEKKKL